MCEAAPPTGPQARPNETEVRQYYEQNPSLFAQRRVYRLQEITTDLPPARTLHRRGEWTNAYDLVVLTLLPEDHHWWFASRTRALEALLEEGHVGAAGHQVGPPVAVHARPVATPGTLTRIATSFSNRGAPRISAIWPRSREESNFLPLAPFS